MILASSGYYPRRHDPEVTKLAKKKLRFGWGPRGIGYWEGEIYVSTTDGRLIALDARSGNNAGAH